ncbi:MAG: twin-arginine translocation signal domain-containing protein [Planctomycetes bacterium]|nr:twin-arginine translocation signal domain-containing protein [Planctomycetota bacterium]
MKRRDFLGTTCAAGAAAAGGAAAAAEAPAPAAKEFLELRLYKADAGPMREKLDKFLAEAALPAWNRLGIQPVGVFASADPKVADLYVLLPHKSIESFATAARKLQADADYQKAGAAALDTPKNEPVYKRVETTLMLAFDAAPKAETPTKKDTRVFQLRIYESHCDERARRKVAMFNEGGEIALFRKVGLQIVFFGETLAGPKMPNLTYMLGFDDEAAQKEAWAKFLAHPDWKKMSSDPQYKNTVSNITNLVLKPTAYSQV